ncbi:hypothetical protein F441_16717 [Phytophthora nicotianae CJ01A1]|uniref:Uncharacterized protein n=5 Tax=Phytophthora nicotianae TaxID=4792 RepID=V9EDU5_PHYNI|nr:hypothetical protein F443_16877 [Phytophthora nicotianae P1569]ETK77320.1 hypothetical protein L915_16411 [Phytophthora nicotianae]ETO65844.1 hypothetical protein F444_16897 [Phytophthora nicotianae P1976]ETP06961.1 hypothetical protein F441_16717 [Phytophthora nicotianae CJ01A1]ETP35050.1 hypothetical protein F442_16709 [Phytophthora nicotianae P10297]KUF81363.1 hypothetical protein AM587_10004071 [Phytophthora nicotianae]
MGGQTSRMVREIVEDSAYIIRQTNRATYERSRATNAEVQTKLTELRRLNKEMLQSAESDAQRSEVFESFQNTVGQQKKALDEQVEGFAKQFELPKSYQKIADAHREEMQQAKVKAEQAAEALKHPEQKQS